MQIVAIIKGFFIHVECVAVFHDELPSANHAAARPFLVAELHLYLVPDLRQIAVGADRVACVITDYLFVGWSEQDGLPLAVLEAE